MFGCRRRGEDVHALFNVGVCARNGVPRVENALNSLVADGTIGTLPEYRVSRRLPSILVNMGREDNKEECRKYFAKQDRAFATESIVLGSIPVEWNFFEKLFRSSQAALLFSIQDGRPIRSWHYSYFECWTPSIIAMYILNFETPIKFRNCR